MQIDGTCHCGRISYNAEVDPASAFLCHCADCQAISGSAFRWIVSVPEAQFELLSGTPKTYVKIGDSGRESHQLFCENCASPLYAFTPGASPMVYRLRVGTVRRRAALIPALEVWHSSAQPWSANLPEARRVERQ